MAQDKLSGVWRSRYRYTSSARKGEFENEHLMRMHQRNDGLVIESIPKADKSYLIVHLILDGNIATGTWQEETEQGGYYKGAIYHGAIQLVLSTDKKHLEGKWVGFGRDMEVNVGPWSFDYIGKEMPKTLPK